MCTMASLHNINEYGERQNKKNVRELYDIWYDKKKRKRYDKRIYNYFVREKEVKNIIIIKWFFIFNHISVKRVKIKKTKKWENKTIFLSH
jgi:curved DNA-binding protein CbpA